MDVRYDSVVMPRTDVSGVPMHDSCKREGEAAASLTVLVFDPTVGHFPASAASTVITPQRLPVRFNPLMVHEVVPTAVVEPNKTPSTYSFIATPGLATLPHVPDMEVVDVVMLAVLMVGVVDVPVAE